jgi:hypothetical protein
MMGITLVGYSVIAGRHMKALKKRAMFTSP